MACPLGEGSEGAVEKGGCMSHTKGPWVIKDTDEEGHYVIQNESGSTAICYGSGFYGKENPGPDNAKLIASAPNLLGCLLALTGAAEGVSKSDPFYWGPILEICNATIAKATGKPVG